MSTPKQAAASRANSQKSTGPRTTAGKTASRFNALKHGIFANYQIMFDETAEDLAELAAEYHEHHKPADPDQRLLVDTLIANEWRLRRMRRVEAALWEQAANRFFTEHPESEACNSADAFATNSGSFERLQRMVNGCERNYHRALKELQRQKSRVLPGAATKVGQALPPANPDAASPEAANPDAPSQPPQPEQSKPTSTSSASFRTNSQAPASEPPLTAPDATPFTDPATPEAQHGSSNGLPTHQEAV
jgi:hypothetical protein